MVTRTPRANSRPGSSQSSWAPQGVVESPVRFLCPVDPGHPMVRSETSAVIVSRCLRCGSYRQVAKRGVEVEPS